VATRHVQPRAGNRRDRARRGGQVGPVPAGLHPSPEAASTPSTQGSDDQSTLLSVAVLMALILLACEAHAMGSKPDRSET
jgi:hypothetical protein